MESFSFPWDYSMMRKWPNLLLLDRRFPWDKVFTSESISKGPLTWRWSSRAVWQLLPRKIQQSSGFSSRMGMDYFNWFNIVSVLCRPHLLLIFLKTVSSYISILWVFLLVLNRGVTHIMYLASGRFEYMVSWLSFRFITKFGNWKLMLRFGIFFSHFIVSWSPFLNN